MLLFFFFSVVYAFVAFASTCASTCLRDEILAMYQGRKIGAFCGLQAFLASISEKGSKRKGRMHFIFLPKISHVDLFFSKIPFGPTRSCS